MAWFFSTFFTTPTEVAVATLTISISLLRRRWMGSGASPSPATMVAIRSTSTRMVSRSPGSSPRRAMTCPLRLSAVVVARIEFRGDADQAPAWAVSRFKPPPWMLLIVVNGFPHGFVAFTGSAAWSDFDFVAHREGSFHDASPNDTSTHFAGAGAGSVDVEGTGDVHDAAHIFGTVRGGDVGFNG